MPYYVWDPKRGPNVDNYPYTDRPPLAADVGMVVLRIRVGSPASVKTLYNQFLKKAGGGGAVRSRRTLGQPIRPAVFSLQPLLYA